MRKPDIGVTAANLKKVTGILTDLLADGMVLYIKTRKFHWNVSGASFMEHHKLFESQYNRLENAIDEIAERISKLGAEAIGTTSEFAKNSQIKETAGKNPASKEMLEELLKDHETIVKTMRKKIDISEEECKDKGTADFITGLMIEHESMAWEIRRYLG